MLRAGDETSWGKWSSARVVLPFVLSSLPQENSMWSLWIYCDQGHRQEGFIDEDGLVLVPDGCDVCEDILNGARRPSKLRMWREIHKLRKSINRMER